MKQTAYELLVLFSLLGVVAVANDGSLDLPIHHPGDKAPVAVATSIPGVSVKQPKVIVLPIPAPDSPTESPDDPDPVDEPLPVIYGEELESESSSVVFLMDRSGSMNLPSGTGTRLDGAKREVTRAIETLPPGWRFSVGVYSYGVSFWSQRLRLATAEAKAEAISFIQGVTAEGATATGQATSWALMLDTSNLYVVLLTDGEPTGPPSWHRSLINDNNRQRAKIDVFGIEATGNMRTFCQNVASDSGGSYHDVN